MRYHPTLGYTYMPSTKLRVQRPGGGYLVQTNSDGFRSDREFVPERPPGVFRALVFGDSQTAGDGMTNSRRFSDRLEQIVPGLEVYNYGLSGTGTDQQYLTFLEHRSVEHDVVIIVLYVENIRRISRRFLTSRDVSGEVLVRAKPYYELHDGELVLCNVPVPKQAWTQETLPKEHLRHVYIYGEEYSLLRQSSPRQASLLRAILPAGPLRRAAKSVVELLKKPQPLPEYDTSRTAEWRLLRAILSTWISDSRTPVLLVPLPHETALYKVSDAGKSRARFRELAHDTGCHLYDPLGDFLQLDDGEREAMWSSAHGHLSALGHEALARWLAPHLQQLMNEHGEAPSPAE